MTKSPLLPGEKFLSFETPHLIEKKIRQSYRAMHWAIVGITVLATINYILLLKHGLIQHL